MRRGAPAPATAGCSAPVAAHAVAGDAVGAAVVRRARRRVRRPAARHSRCSRRSRTRDLLVQLGRRRPARRCPRWTGSARAAAELRALPGVRNVGAHVGRAIARRPGGRRQLRRALGQHRPGADYDATVGAVERRRRTAIRACDTEVLTYSSDRIERGARPDRATRSGARLRPGPRRPAREGRRGPRRCWRGSTASRDAHGRSADRRADDRDRGRPRQGRRRPASSPATSAGPRPRCCRASRSAASSRTRRSSRSWSGARPRSATA